MFYQFGDFVRNVWSYENKQRLIEIPYNMALPENAQLSYVSQNEGFGDYQPPSFGGDDDGNDEGRRISWPPPASILSRPGIQYPVRATPHSDL